VVPDASAPQDLCCRRSPNCYSSAYTGNCNSQACRSFKAKGRSQHASRCCDNVVYPRLEHPGLYFHAQRVAVFSFDVSWAPYAMLVGRFRHTAWFYVQLNSVKATSQSAPLCIAIPRLSRDLRRIVVAVPRQGRTQHSYFRRKILANMSSTTLINTMLPTTMMPWHGASSGRFESAYTTIWYLINILN
jgi:hypothetical protein